MSIIEKMNSLPLVSVILPTYNRIEFLQRAINSVLLQSITDWELIIWDDGSTDGTADFCQSFRDQRIRYFWHENRGVSFARNRAIEKSVGTYLAFLDSDDEWLPDRLSLQIEILEQFPEIDMIFSNFLNVNLLNETSTVAFSAMADSFGKMKTKALTDGFFLIEDRFLEGVAADNFIATDTVILKKKLVQKLSGFDETLRFAEDFELWWRLGLAGVKLGYVDKILLNRNKPAGSLSSHSINTYQNLINALDICSQNALLANREDLLKHLDKPYRNAWQNMISAYAMENDKKGMMTAFKNSLKYGFRLGLLRLLIEGLLHSGGSR